MFRSFLFIRIRAQLCRPSIFNSPFFFLYFADRTTTKMRRKFTLYLKVTIRRLSNPVFFMLLALSLILWYVTKLSYTYSTDINIPVRIDSTLFSVRCNVEGVDTKSCSTRSLPEKTASSSLRITLRSSPPQPRPDSTTSLPSRYKTSFHLK